MLKTLKSGGSFKFQGWILNAGRQRIASKKPHVKVLLFAISPNGDALELPVARFGELDTVLEKMFHEINSRSYLPESAYRNGVRLDTEHRCQSSKCNRNPAGESRLLFMSAGKLTQVIQVKCRCGYMNTFWRNRIKLDASGSLKMEAA